MMNRDERRNRHEAGLKNVINNGIKCCYPVDGLAGGTWIGASENGIVICLLNRYQVPILEEAKSRGGIIPAALAQSSFDNINDFIARSDYKDHNGFDCIVASQTAAIHFSWDRKTLSKKILDLRKPQLFTSSSERLTEVSRYRQQLFDQWVSQRSINDKTNDDNANCFHFQQAHKQAASAVMMSREHTHTKSFVTVELETKKTTLQYFDDAQKLTNQNLSDCKPTKQWSAPMPLI
jgi:uncharacterized protein with NRDE domain